MNQDIISRKLHGNEFGIWFNLVKQVHGEDLRQLDILTQIEKAGVKEEAERNYRNG